MDIKYKHGKSKNGVVEVYITRNSANQEVMELKSSYKALSNNLCVRGIFDKGEQRVNVIMDIGESDYDLHKFKFVFGVWGNHVNVKY